MPAIDDLVKILISPSPTAVETTVTTLPLLIANEAPDWGNDDFLRTYSSTAEMVADGFESDSDAVVYANKLLSQGPQPTFMVGRKAGAAITAADLDALSAQDDSFYGIIPVKGSDEEIYTVADWTQGRSKMQFAASAALDNLDKDSETSLAALLRKASMSRTALMVSPGSADKGIEAAWVGGQLPLLPGSNNWAYKTLAGIPTDALSTAQRHAAIGIPSSDPIVLGNGSNVYLNLLGRGATQMGTTSSGGYIDNIIGQDWLEFNLKSELFSVLADSAKVPYTDRGVALLISKVRSVLMQGAANGLIDDTALLSDGKTMGISVKAASVASVSKSAKIARRSPAINFECVLQGAINSVTVVGTVSL